MALDEALLENAGRLQRPVLRFYSWSEPAASFGYFQHFSEVEKLTLLRPLVRRPTGGGIVPHDADWTYSLAFPVAHPWHQLSARESYERVHAWIARAFQKMGIAAELAPTCLKSAPGQCFIGHEQHDVLWMGKKIAGAAQRRNRLGLLIQGSVQPPPLSLDREKWEEAMRQVGTESENVIWKDWKPDPELCERARKLREEKHSQEAYVKKR